MMHKMSLLLGLLALAWAGPAAGQDLPADAQPVSPTAGADTERSAAAAPSLMAAPLPPAAEREDRMYVGVAFLPMVLGKLQGGNEALIPSTDAAVAYGVGLSFGYTFVRGLSIGVAPQVLFNVKPKGDPNDAATECDLLARLAYTHALTRSFAIYGELLPGYSVVVLPGRLTDAAGVDVSHPKGMVVAFGAGASLEITDRYFVNLGLGFQLGSQKGSVGGISFNDKTKFVRIAIGGGVRL
jgi:hypothetical protein